MFTYKFEGTTGIRMGKNSTFIFFLQILSFLNLIIFALILALQVGVSPTWEGPGYATEGSGISICFSQPCTSPLTGLLVLHEMW